MTYATRRNRLAAREKEILLWLAKGKSAHETGIILNISVCTVRIHVQNIKRKLDASNIPHAIAKAFDEGILVPSSTSGRAAGGLFSLAAEVKDNSETTVGEEHDFADSTSSARLGRSAFRAPSACADI